jgi:hypothetical protein
VLRGVAWKTEIAPRYKTLTEELRRGGGHHRSTMASHTYAV